MIQVVDRDSKKVSLQSRNEDGPLYENHSLGDGQAIEMEMAHQVGTKIFRFFEPPTTHSYSDEVDRLVSKIISWCKDGCRDLSDCNIIIESQSKGYAEDVRAVRQAMMPVHPARNEVDTRAVAAQPQSPEEEGLAGSCIRRQAPHDSEFMKCPNLALYSEMLRHIRNCQHDGCHRVWRGCWGHFIGGFDGKTHFDLTECPKGRRLNELTGWDYEDPLR